jgi:hypothetical protein
VFNKKDISIYIDNTPFHFAHLLSSGFLVLIGDGKKKDSLKKSDLVTSQALETFATLPYLKK